MKLYAIMAHIVMLFGLVGCSDNYGFEFDVSDLVKRCKNIVVYDVSGEVSERPELKKVAQELCMLPIKHFKELQNGKTDSFRGDYERIIKSSNHDPQHFSVWDVAYPFFVPLENEQKQECNRRYNISSDSPIDSSMVAISARKSLCLQQHLVGSQKSVYSLEKWFENTKIIPMWRLIANRMKSN